jgi:uncharacterized protein YfaS (alpha-2-macroglobulin family)
MSRLRLSALLALSSCGPGLAPVAPAVPSGADATRFEELAPEQLGLKMTFRDARPADGVEQVARPPTTPLSAAEVDALLARAPANGEQAGDVKAFALRKGPTPPPLTGATVNVPFPPPPEGPPPEVAAAPLSVVRYAPQGAVPMVPNLSVTFSQPMVAVTSQEEAAKTVPVQLTPTPKGRWRWLGTKTIVFDPDPATDDGSVTGRFPMSTSYQVKIPAGTKSATGGVLDKEVSFAFETPTMHVVSAGPYDSAPQSREPVLVMVFDQAIDRAAIEAKLTLKADRQTFAVRAATDAEIAADPVAKALTGDAQRNRWIAVRPASPLPTATSFTLTLPKGVTSVEGPLPTTDASSISFFTYAPLVITSHQCEWGDECRPTASWSARFNNPLDAAFDPAGWKVDPPVPGWRVEASGDWVMMSGQFTGRTNYRVSVPADVKDKFGQQLGRADTLQFKVGPAEKTLSGPSAGLTVLDPSAKGKVSVHSTNHKALKVRVYEVEPDQYAAWESWMNRWRWDDAAPKVPPGRQVRDAMVQVKGSPDAMTETVLDLGDLLHDGHGQLILWVEPTEQPKEEWNRQYVVSWIQQTDLGLTAFADDTDLVGWVSDLATGAPIEGAELYLLGPDGRRVVSGAEGLASLPLPVTAWKPDATQVLVARKGGDVAILPQSVAGTWWGGSSSWVRADRVAGLRWYLFDDRGLYKPGEQAKIKGWLRRYEPGKGGDVRGLDGRPTKLTWKLSDSVGNELAHGDATVSRLGGFDFAVDLPKDMNLGSALVEIAAVDASGVTDTSTYHSLNVQEFRRPEFEVATTVVNDRPHVVGEDVFASVKASYFAGGGLAAAPVSWVAIASPTSFVPAGRDEWSFGAWSPWWWGRGGDEVWTVGPATHDGKTDASGEHAVAVHLDGVRPARPMSVHVESTVYDVNRQAWTSSGDFVAHPADLYVGLKTPRTFVEKGQPIDVSTLVVDIDGAAVSNVAVDLSIARKEWGWKNGRYAEESLDATSCQVTSAADAQQCSFKFDVGGSYAITAKIRDGHGRENLTDLRVWVEGGDVVPARDVELEKVVLVPEKNDFQPGDTAKFLVQAPFYPAEGTLTVRRSGLIEARRFRMETATTTLEVPITDALTPNVTVQVDLVGQAVRVDDHGQKHPALPKRPAFASGALELKVPPRKRTLQVEVSPAQAKIAPGGSTDLAVMVRDADGKPLSNAEVAVVVVDEAVLALTGYRIPDPVALFYEAREAGVSDGHLRSHILLSRPDTLPVGQGGAGKGDFGGLSGSGSLGMSGFGRGGGGAVMPVPVSAAPMAAMEETADMSQGKAERSENQMSLMKRVADKSVALLSQPDAATPIAVRTDFSALALFAPAVRTDASGAAKVPLKLPDSLTRYRVVAVAVAGERQFGMGESNVTARLPLMVRPSAPRFLNYGDEFELPVVVQNQTDAPMTVNLAVRASNVGFVSALGAPRGSGAASAGRQVVVPANDRVEVRFPATAGMPGTARFQAVAATEGGQDAANFDLPVWTPATTEAFATYGDIASGATTQPIQLPPNVEPSFGGLEVTASSTQLQALTDAVLYLSSYPYDCNEQIASRMLAIASLRDVLGAFQSSELPPPEVLRDSVKADLDRLAKRQNGNGGWAFWRRGDPDWPYLTIHVAEALAASKAKGYEVDGEMWEGTLRYLRGIQSHIPSWYSEESRLAIRAYAIDARFRMGDPDVAEAKKIYREAGATKLRVDGQAWLLPTLASGKAKEETSAILKNLSNGVTETAGAAHFVTSYSDGAYVLLNSDRRADGIILDALLQVDPTNDVIPKVVRGLLAHRTRGHWSNTQENAFVLLAMDRYFHVYEKETPAFVARVWLGDGYAGDHTFRGRTTERAQIDVPMSYLATQPSSVPLTIQRDGDAGRLYYRVGMRYAPSSLELQPVDDGFAVTRLYEAIDNPADVSRDPQGTWHIKAGSRVRVRLSMATPARRYHVALVDPLPAGLEVLNPDLATSGAVPGDDNERSSPYWWWTRTWYEHENLRDDRIEAFAAQVWDGVYDYTYVARATTPGRFVVPPTKAEEMYSPETFGRAGTDRVVVE